MDLVPNLLKDSCTPIRKRKGLGQMTWLGETQRRFKTLKLLYQEDMKGVEHAHLHKTFDRLPESLASVIGKCFLFVYLRFCLFI